MEERRPAAAYLHMNTANSLFPFSQRIRTGFAIIHTMVPTLPKEYAIQAVEAALRDDPYGPVPLYHGIIHHAKSKNIVRANELLSIMVERYPDWLYTKQMESLVSALNQ